MERNAKCVTIQRMLLNSKANLLISIKRVTQSQYWKKDSRSRWISSLDSRRESQTLSRDEKGRNQAPQSETSNTEPTHKEKRKNSDRWEFQQLKTEYIKI